MVRPYTHLQLVLFYLFPLGILLSLAVFDRKKKVYFGIILIIYIFLAKGLNEPLKDLSIFLFESLPILHAFRDPTKFVAFIVFLYAWILPIGLLVGKDYLKNLHRIAYYGLTIGFLVLLTIVNTRFFSGDFEKAMYKVSIPTEYIETQQYLKKASGGVIYAPFESTMIDFTWYKNMVIPSSHFTPFHLYLPLSVPIYNGYINDYSNTYSQRYMEYVQSIDDIEQQLLMFQKIGVEYIIVDSNITPNSPNYSKVIIYKSKLSGSTNVLLEKKFNNIEIYKLAKYQNNQMTAWMNPIYTISDLSIYDKLFVINPDLMLQPVVFLNQPGVLTKVNLSGSKLFLNNRTVEDLLGDLLIDTYQVDVLNQLSYKPDTTGWINYESLKTAVNDSLHYFALDFMSKQMIASEGPGTDSWTLHRNPGRYVFMVRPLYGTTYKNKPFGNFSITLGDQHFNLDLTDSQIGLHWRVLGTVHVEQDSELTLHKENNGLALLDGILLIPEESFNQEKNKLDSVLNNSEIETDLNGLKNISQDDEILSYKVDNPAEFNLDKGIDRGILEFKQTFSPNWSVDSSASFPIDYFATGFVIQKSVSQVQYSPEILFSKLLLLSKAVCLLVFGLVTFILIKKPLVNFLKKRYDH
jgi:hypothetical protein